jgi:sulfide:quinone oxidoreductase
MSRDQKPMHVLIAGGGVAALEAALALRALADDLVRVELLSPEPLFWYRPLSVAEPFGLGSAKAFPLPELAAAAGATCTPGSLAAVDVERKHVTTASGDALSYDVLLLACGAVPRPAVAGALTFRGPADTTALSRLLDDTASRGAGRVAFVVPWGAVWSLPIYELALMSATYFADRGAGDVELTLVTPEEEPLQVFGRAASDTVRRLLDGRGIAIRTTASGVELVDGELRLVPDGSIPADRAIALPRLHGPRIDGVAQTADGFVPVDAYGRVRGLDNVFAAGDVTTFPVKQGGIATQQADVAAVLIAEEAGADVAPEPFRPVLRGLLLTGRQPRYLRRDATHGPGDDSSISLEPLWWPPAKIVGRYLAPFLAEAAGVEPPPEPVADRAALPVEVELDAQATAVQRPLPIDTGSGDAESVADAMAPATLVVAPEDTLGEVCAQMRELHLGSAVVADFGRLIGILTSRDLLRAFAARVHPSEARVREWMTAEPVAVAADTPLGAASALMTEYGFHQLPVVDDEQPIGMLGQRQAAGRIPASAR